MSLIIKNNRVSSTSGLAPLQDRLASLRISGLAGLYMFEDGTIGQPYTTALDVSGNAKHAPARTIGGFVTPVHQAYGIQIPAGADITHCGAVFDTGIARTDGSTGFTVISAYLDQSTGMVTGINDYIGLIGSDAAITGPNAYSSTVEPGLPLTHRRQLISGTNYENPGSVDLKGTFVSSTALTSFDAFSNNVAAGRGNISVLRLDPAAKTASLDVAPITGASVSVKHAVALKSGWTPVPVSRNWSIGLFGVYNSTASLIQAGQAYAYAIYTKPLSDTEVAAAIVNLQAVFAKRGVSS